MKTKKIFLSKTDKKIAGVCGGIGEAFDVDSTLIRLIWIFLTAVSGVVPGIVAYLISWMIIPKKP